MYFLDIKKGKYNLGKLPNSIIDKHIHSIKFQKILIEINNKNIPKPIDYGYYYILYNFIFFSIIILQIFYL